MTDEQRSAPPEDESSVSATAAVDVATGDGDTEPAPAAFDEVASERDQLRDLLLRKTAEFDNFRKRTERERSEFARRAAEDLLLDLLPLVDDLERALDVAAETPDGESYRKGVELIHRQLLELLRKRHVTPIETVGEPFDPNLHEAVTQEPSDDHPEGTVVKEFRRGYRLGDRLLRAAVVVVAAGGSGDADATPAANGGADADDGAATNDSGAADDNGAMDEDPRS